MKPSSRPDQEDEGSDFSCSDSDDPVTPARIDSSQPKKNASEKNEDIVPVEFPQADTLVPFKSNIVQHLSGISYTWKRSYLHHEAQIGKVAVKGSLDRFQVADYNSRFQRRITEISWHPKEPYLVGAACKRGDLILLKGSYDRNEDLKFTQKLGLKGCGAGGAVFAIRFEENRRNIFYTAGLEGVVNSYNVEGGALLHEFYNTNDYHQWFTSMDVSQHTRTLLAGCTKGKVYMSTLDGEKVVEVKLHKGKVLHCEFNQSLPHLIATSSIDKTVKLWDLRKLRENDPLSVLQHDKPVNVAHFNPSNNTRLLISDQKDEIRVYDGPNWTRTTTIVQPHRQFQHLTAIVAKWHPLSDIIVIGKYPVVPKGTKPVYQPPRPIQFFDADTGNKIHDLLPPTNEIVSLNCFNPLGDVLASGQGRTLLFFNAQDQNVYMKKQWKPRNSSLAKLHFNNRRDNSPSEDSEEDSQPKRKKLRTSTSTAGGTTTKKGKTSGRNCQKGKGK